MIRAITRRPPIAPPTPAPAFAPVERPLEPSSGDEVPVGDADVDVLDEVDDAVNVETLAL